MSDWLTKGERERRLRGSLKQLNVLSPSYLIVQLIKGKEVPRIRESGIP